MYPFSRNVRTLLLKFIYGYERMNGKIFYGMRNSLLVAPWCSSYRYCTTSSMFKLRDFCSMFSHFSTLCMEWLKFFIQNIFKRKNCSFLDWKMNCEMSKSVLSMCSVRLYRLWRLYYWVWVNKTYHFTYHIYLSYLCSPSVVHLIFQVAGCLVIWSWISSEGYLFDFPCSVFFIAKFIDSLLFCII